MKRPPLSRPGSQITSRRSILAMVLIIFALGVAVLTPLMAFTPLGETTFAAIGLAKPTPPPLVPIQFPQIQRLTVDKAPPSVLAEAAYLEDVQAGTILLNKQATNRIAIGSTTKVMTALIAIQSNRPDCSVKIKQYILDHVIENNSSNAGLALGETFTVKELLPGLMLPSGGDAALAIAECLYGSEKPFVEQMNRLAQRLHLYHTQFNTIDGRDEPENYSTAIDMTKLAIYALDVPEFAEVVKLNTYHLSSTSTHSGYTWKNTNTLMKTYDGMLGVKTGYTIRAGYCLIFAAKRHDQYLAGAIFNSPGPDERVEDAGTILEWGFSLPVKVVL